MIELLRRFGGKFLRYMVIGPACKLIEVIFDLLTPLVIAQMIDKGIGARDVNAVVHYGMVLGAMAVIGISFTLVCQKMAALTSQGMGTDIRGALYKHINKLSYAELDRFGTPSLITRITNDVNQVQLAVALGVRMLIRWPFLAVGSMCAALAIDLKLGIIFLICTPAIGLVFWFVMARCIPYYRQLQAKLDRIALICREGLSGARVVRAFVREDHERERFAQAADDQANTAIAVGKLSSILNPVTFLVMNLGVCAILWVVKECHDEVRISIAHTCTDYDTAKEAFAAGATHMTHLYNAMPGITHRAPGPIIAALEEGAEVELITDNVHIHPAVVRFTFNTFGDDHVILIADSMMACGLPDGQYSLGGQAVTVHGRRATLTEQEGTIAGSATCLFDCMKRAVQEMGVPLESAVRAATLNPARSIGVDADYGSLEAGRWGNVVLVDDQLNIQTVVRHGQIL